MYYYDFYHLGRLPTSCTFLGCTYPTLFASIASLLRHLKKHGIADDALRQYVPHITVTT